MRLNFDLTSVWRIPLLLLWFLSFVYAATERDDLEKLNSDPDFAIIQLDVNEVPDGGYYKFPAAPGSRMRYAFACKADRKYTSYTEAGTTFVACCSDGEHLSGSTSIGFSCCAANTERSGDANTGYACCPKGKHASGDATTGDPKKYLCCDAGTERKGSDATGYFCCGTGEDVVGSDPIGYACCPLGQQISGSAKTGQYLCCGPDHERAGTAATGYSCCLEGWSFDGKLCQPPKFQCENGKQLDSDGKCVCPTGLVEDGTGKCAPVPPPPPPPAAAACSSGIVSGKCYQIINTDGKVWGSTHGGSYVSKPLTEESAHFKAGKFKFCVDQSCKPDIAINPGTGFSLLDLHGLPPGGNRARQWLNNIHSGGHMSKTADWSKAGRFSVTKWPCGKYCIGGAGTPPRGLGYTCPTGDGRGMTFYVSDPQACLEVTLKEIPCDIRQQSNNCIWKTPSDQCCGGNVDCSASAAGAADAPTAQKPLGKN